MNVNVRIARICFIESVIHRDLTIPSRSSMNKRRINLDKLTAGASHHGAERTQKTSVLNSVCILVAGVQRRSKQIEKGRYSRVN
jgi:hypothetical protein